MVYLSPSFTSIHATLLHRTAPLCSLSSILSEEAPPAKESKMIPALLLFCYFPHSRSCISFERRWIDMLSRTQSKGYECNIMESPLHMSSLAEKERGKFLSIALHLFNTICFLYEALFSSLEFLLPAFRMILED